MKQIIKKAFPLSHSFDDYFGVVNYDATYV